MLIIRNLNLISVQSWTYLKHFTVIKSLNNQVYEDVAFCTLCGPIKSLSNCLKGAAVRHFRKEKKSGAGLISQSLVG